MYRTPDKRLKCISNFLAEGITCCEQVLCVGECFNLSGNIAAHNKFAVNQLKLTTLADLVPVDDILAPSSYLDNLLKLVTQSLQDGFCGARLIIEMASGLSYLTPGQFVLFEAALAAMPEECPCVILCLYNQNLFPDYLLQSVLKAHPLVATTRGVAHNPVYRDVWSCSHGH